MKQLPTYLLNKSINIIERFMLLLITFYGNNYSFISFYTTLLFSFYSVMYLFSFHVECKETNVKFIDMVNTDMSEFTLAKYTN